MSAVRRITDGHGHFQYYSTATGHLLSETQLKEHAKGMRKQQAMNRLKQYIRSSQQFAYNKGAQVEADKHKPEKPKYRKLEGTEGAMQGFLGTMNEPSTKSD